MTTEQHMDALLQGFAQSSLPGCACALAQNGQVLYEGYAGFADVESGRPIQEDTVYRLFSMTKVVVCTAAMMLFERGKFLLNEPLYAYLPEYRHHTVVTTAPNGMPHLAESKNPMLVKHAFSMAVGLPYPGGDSITENAIRQVQQQLAKQHGKYTLRQELKAMAAVPLAFQPGQHFLYGYGHDLVAGLVEVVSGKTIGQFLQQELFDPLGMKDTGYRYFGDIQQRMATCYNRAEDGTLSPTPGMLDAHHEPDALYEGGGAGLFSTLRDYLAFTQMLANGGQHQGQRIIGRKTIDLMRTNQLDAVQLRDFENSYVAGYGYGLGVRTMLDKAAGNSNSSIGEFGWTGALGTWTSIDPSEGFSVVYMHQMQPNMEEHHHLRVRAAAYAFL